MNKPYARANQLAAQVFRDFMAQVVEQHVLNERVFPVKEIDKKPLAEGKIINLDTIKLMSLSGKGGYSADPEKFARYRKNSNITLLDHMLSVTRGALVLAVLSWLQANPEMDEAVVIERLKVLAVTAFLHDLDKMLQLPRNEALTLEHVELAMQRYGIVEFLGDIQLSAEQLRFLIEQVETSQAFRHPCQQEPKHAYGVDAKRYAQLADKLDGLWCADGSRQGLEAIMTYMQGSNALASDLLSQWQAVDIFDPHHPFLLDELQRNLSYACRMESGIPPLLETHQDGRLFMLLPASYGQAVIKRGIARLLDCLPFNLELIISNRGIPELRNGQPDVERYRHFIEAAEQRRELGRLFLLSNSLIDALTPAMDANFSCVSLQPRWPGKITGQMSTPYPNPDELDYQGLQALFKAAQLTLLLTLKLPVTKKNGLPDYTQREQQLLDTLDMALPVWLESLTDAQSKRILLGIWAVAVTHDDVDKQARIWGEQGLLQTWLEGTEGQDGFNQHFAGEGVDALNAVKRHFSQLLNQRRLSPEDEAATGRCLFTDSPTNTLISSSLNLYEVKVSAFTGREGKPDSITAPASGEVPISLVSLAEHKLRQQVFVVQGGKPSGVPTLVSSPVTTGLFGALVLDNKLLFKALSSYDLSRKKEEGKAVYRGLEIYRYRYRMARLERIPERTEDQIQTLRLLLQGCLRVGRPLHLFRGLPTPQKAFFYFDAMPRILQNLIGANELRLEEIPAAIKRLEIAETISAATGLGYDVLTLYALKQTRFAACALIWGYAEDKLDDKKLANAMHYLQNQMIQSQQESEMSEQDGALVRLGRAATVIQYMPTKHSHSEELLVFNLCMETAASSLSLKNPQSDRSSLINGIAGFLAVNLDRKDKRGFGLNRDDLLEEACLKFAEQFVDEVWFSVLGGKPPAQKEKRLLAAIYRMAFIQTHREAAKQRKAEKTQQTENSTAMSEA
ncbi:hypothetical protein [Thiothrix nivea]|uniref:CRISPR-associated protein Csc3 n=1 Tax=Thiothrix nivea (strain ATCC 35100 / DSM 5205 / JP2) TaxID=870187 RepID=A0A656HCH8_THINJ|nr:hypothetical protein [Thiothrix nivea]EIJ32869.1 hypothetical protein Thini_0206 [Thiothrix nivea DSM 5205]